MKSRLLAIVAVVIAVLLAGFMLGMSLSRLLNRKAPGVILDTTSVVQQIQTLSELVTVKYVIEKVVVLRRCGNEVHIAEGRDVWWHRELEYVDDDCPAEKMDSEAPLFRGTEVHAHHAFGSCRCSDALRLVGLETCAALT